MGKRVALTLLGFLAVLLPLSAEGTAEMTGEQGSVSVLAVWTGNEQEIFLDSLVPFEDISGVQIDYEATRDINAVLTTRVQAGNPPDVAVLPGPGQMAQFARQGALVDLNTVLDVDRLSRDFAQGWIDLGTVDGELVGIFVKAAIKGLIWYNPSAVQARGISVPPQSWDELMQISRRLAGQGRPPWAVGLESGAASGWPGTDWIEDIVLRTAGPDKYREWYEGKLAWTSPEIKNAWQIWGEIVGDDSMVFGGKQSVLSTGFGDGANPLFTSPPRAYFHHQASFIQSFIQEAYPDLVPVDDFDFFGFPPIESMYGKAVEGAGDIMGVLNATSQSVELMQYLATGTAQAYWVRAGAGISPNRTVKLSEYPDPLGRRAAEILTGADIVAFDASDLMPGAMNEAFWAKVMEFVQNPARLDTILQDLDAVRREAY